MAKINVEKNRTTQLEITTSDNTVTVGKGIVFNAQTNGIVESGSASGNHYVIKGAVISHEFGNASLSYSGADTIVNIEDGGKLKSDYWAIRAFGDESRIVNDGRILGAAVGIGIAGDNARVINHGTIASTNGTAIDTDNLAKFRLDSDGTITSDAGLHLRVENLTLNFARSSVVEFGSSGAIDTSLSQAGWTARITNAGEITNKGNGMINAISGGAGVEIVRNSGSMTGFVNLGEGDDRYDGRGGRLHEGTVFGGDGNDTYLLSSSKDKVHESAGFGYDKLTVSFSYKLGLNNEIEETYLAGRGDHNLTGNAYGNYLQGNRGDNHLAGKAGMDAFFGGAGDDVITGGADTDVFYFKQNADREIITDFTDGEDFLVLFGGKDIKSVNDLLNHHVHQDGKDLVISGDGTEMVLRNFDKDDLTTADFTV